jgi:hypothetical protein
MGNMDFVGRVFSFAGGNGANEIASKSASAVSGAGAKSVDFARSLFTRR